MFCILKNRDYRNLVTNFFSEMKSRGIAGGNQIYWVESVAIPLHQDENLINYKDWRTYHRLLLFDNIVKETLKSIKYVHVVPAFQSTLVTKELKIFLFISMFSFSMSRARIITLKC